MTYGISLHFIHYAGVNAIHTFTKLGDYPPSLDAKVSREAPFEHLSRPVGSLRGRVSPSTGGTATPKYLPPLKPKDHPDNLSPGKTFVIVLIHALCQELRDRVSSSLKNGRSRAWPYSPRDLLLLVKNKIDTGSTASDESSVIPACAASVLVQKLAEWSAGYHMGLQLHS